ncbi:MAG: glycosyl hydrolase, partial [Anaerolineae bacterium]
MITNRTAITLVVSLGSILLGFGHPPNVAATGVPDPRFGIVEAHEAPAAATALGVGWTRVTFRWNEIQPQGSNEWTVPISDQALASELAQGRQVVGLLVTTPGWATNASIGPGVPKGLYLPVDDPNNLWASFVRTIVGRYTGRIDHWIIWNEPDIPATQHMSWRGSVEDFVQLLQVAYTVAKETNPNAVVHMAAVTHWWNEHWFGRFLDTLVGTPHAAVNDYYFDVATLHIYFQPETVYDITAHYAGMMRGQGIQKPVWIAETNAAPSQDPAWPVPDAQFDVTLDEQAYYIVQSLSLGIAAGAERIAVYKMADTETDRVANPEPFGLVRMDGSRRPAFTAYRVAMTYLAGFRRATWDRRDDISLVTVDRGGQTTTVIWSRTPESQIAMVAARTTRALLVDVWGTAHHVYPERGYYFIDLPGARCAQGCMIGGAPYMLVEAAPASANTAPAPRSPTPPPVEKSDPDDAFDADASPPYTPSFTPTPTSTPTPSPTPTSTPTSTPTPTSRP